MFTHDASKNKRLIFFIVDKTVEKETLLAL